jgi:hypothetical protein
MYCPACGADAGNAKFCPECGTNLKALAGPPPCSACGAEIPQGARFCPECGEPAPGSAASRRAPHATPVEGGETAATASGGGRRTGTRGRGGAGQQHPRPPRAEQPARGKGGGAAAAKPAGRVSPLIAWGVIVAVVAVAAVVVVFYAAGRGGGSGTAASPGAASVQPVAADTSGSYGELVQRANDLYDQGAVKFQAKQYAQGGEYYAAASKVYAAAWKQQATDPAVGTDFATALFYSGKIAAALEQVDKVLAQSPDFQTAWFNKGNYLAEKASQADKAGSAKAAKAAYAGARVAYQKAIDLDPGSSSGQQAQAQLSALPSPSP